MLARMSSVELPVPPVNGTVPETSKTTWESAGRLANSATSPLPEASQVAPPLAVQVQVIPSRAGAVRLLMRMPLASKSGLLLSTRSV